MDNEKADGEGNICTGQKSGVENTATDRNRVVTPAETAPATTETAKLSAPAAEAATVADKPTIAAVAAPTESENFISGSTNNAAEPNITAAAEHIHAIVATKWIPATAVGTT